MTSTLYRPDELDELVGQSELRARLAIVMRGAQLRGTRPPHVLLSGPPGTGKTTLGHIVAHELGAELVATSGPMLRRGGDLAGILCSLPAEGVSVVFIDEIHRLPSVVEEVLYEALEDGTLSLVVGNGNEARSVKLPLPSFVVVGATTKPGALSQPFRDRFGFHGVTAPYSDEEIAEIVARHWRRACQSWGFDATMAVAKRSKGVPRLALHLAERVLDVTALEDSGITGATATRALEAFGIGEHGLDEVDWRILEALCVTFAGRAIGLEALAQAIDVDSATIEREHEGSLVRGGLVVRTHSGRMATERAYELVRS